MSTDRDNAEVTTIADDSLDESSGTRPNGAVLDVRNLSMHFPIKRGFFRRTVGHVRAVDDVSFQINPGETPGA